MREPSRRTFGVAPSSRRRPCLARPSPRPPAAPVHAPPSSRRGLTTRRSRCRRTSAATPAAKPEVPLLLDVTPHSLGVETVGGYCEPVIKRNAAIPVEQTRVFSTATDMQESVRVRVVQGESRRLEDNQPLGEIELSGSAAGARAAR
jgi:molecular chaperone DnaK